MSQTRQSWIGPPDCWLLLLAIAASAVVCGTTRAESPPPAINPAPTAAPATGAAGDGSPDVETVFFATDVVPVLTRLGCNGGGCHGKATGQNGFRLSLFGFEPDYDFEALVHEDRGRRLNAAEPAASLLLRKATAQVPHGGGRRTDPDSADYRVLQNWMALGAPPPRNTDPSLVGLELEPRGVTLAPGASQPLRAWATFSNGDRREVTRLAVYQSNEPDIANVDSAGQLAVGQQPGLAAIMARLGDQIALCEVAVPQPVTAEQAPRLAARWSEIEQAPGASAIDRLLVKQWRRLNVLPAPPADDATFLRRVFLDLCGTLPAPAEVEAFQRDARPDKRAQWVDQLLARPEHASYFALKWADILQNRGGGYSTSQQRAGTALFAGWIRDAIASNMPYDQFVSEILTARGSQAENPPAVWYRAVRKLPDYVESVSQAFLGIRMQCAQCHHHPTERWSQADYYALAAVFARVGRKEGFADAEVPTEEVIYLKDRGEVRHPRTGELLTPRAPGGPEFPPQPGEDPRESLARWLASPENPWFARTLANRLWAHFLGRGLIHPLDDARSTNPPSNPELLDELARQLVASRYDARVLIKSIVLSSAYGLSTAGTSGQSADGQTFSRFQPRRLPAEVLLDGISQVLEVSTPFPGLPAGTRAIDLPDENVPLNFLDVFGRPGRRTACECERVDAPALTQGLELVNSAELQRKLTDPAGYATRAAGSAASAVELADELFVRVLARPARPEERQAAVAVLETPGDRAESVRSLLWALLATNEFLFNH
ncbi:MAG: DUF1549 domain-containing protein [Planctomycetaceae bacterium]